MLIFPMYFAQMHGQGNTVKTLHFRGDNIAYCYMGNTDFLCIDIYS